MKRRLTSLTLVLLAASALASGNSAAQSQSDNIVIDLAPEASPYQTTGPPLLSLPIAQVTDQVPSPTAPQKKPDIHYVPTPQELVEVMLDMAKVGKDDIVYDLGSGDGRLVISAAKKYAATGVGIDIDPQRIGESKENAKKAGVEDKVRFREQDIFESDFHEATVVTLYLLSELNVRLRPKILAQVKPGTRVVSHAFMMGDWQPDEHKTIAINGQGYDAYYWLVPANMSGHWNVTSDQSSDFPHSVHVDQRFQKIIVYSGDTGELLGEGKVNGSTFTVRMKSKGANTGLNSFQGKIDGDTIEATSVGREERQWRATREEGSKAALDAGAVN